MEARSIEKIQGRLERITSRWWFLLAILLISFFTPLYVSQGYDPRETPEIIQAVLSNPLIYKLPALFVLAKAIPIALITAVIFFREKAAPFFNIYVSILMVALALFQNAAVTSKYGLVIILGNVVSVLMVAIFWIWETIAKRNTFAPQKQPLWRFWVVPLAFLAFWFPVDTTSITPRFSLPSLFANEAGLTWCMMAPVILAVLALFYHRVNQATFRVTGFVGTIFGTINLFTWFILKPSMWWMGVLHLPLFLISVYAFALSMGRPGEMAMGFDAERNANGKRV